MPETHAAQPDGSPAAGRHVDLLGWALFALLLAVALVRSGFLLGPLYGDEQHFFPSTVELIPFRVAKLQTFREISSPTFFIAFSYVLQVLGPRVFWCRLAVLGCLLGSVFAYRGIAFGAAARAGLPRLLPALSWALLATFPYLVGCGVYYYTDVPALLFGLLAYGAYERQRTGQAAAWATLAVHCRQYLIFLPAGVIAHEAWQWWRTGDRGALARAATWLLPFVTYVPYLLIWRGPSPMGALDPRQAALPFVQPWHVTYLLAAAGVYLLPLGLAACRAGWTRRKAAFVALAVALFFVWPPRPNLYYRVAEAPIETLELLDSALRGLLGSLGARAALAVGIALAAALHYELLFRNIREARPVALMIAAFWGMSLFSQVAREKYLLPVIPLIYLAALKHPGLCTVVLRATTREPELRTA